MYRAMFVILMCTYIHTRGIAHGARAKKASSKFYGDDRTPLATSCPRPSTAPPHTNAPPKYVVHPPSICACMTCGLFIRPPRRLLPLAADDPHDAFPPILFKRWCSPRLSSRERRDTFRLSTRSSGPPRPRRSARWVGGDRQPGRSDSHGRQQEKESETRRGQLDT